MEYEANQALMENFFRSSGGIFAGEEPTPWEHMQAAVDRIERTMPYVMILYPDQAYEALLRYGRQDSVVRVGHRLFTWYNGALYLVGACGQCGGWVHHGPITLHLDQPITLRLAHQEIAAIEAHWADYEQYHNCAAEGAANATRP